MSRAQQRLMVLWAVLLSGVVCLVFLPVSRLTAGVVLLAAWGVAAWVWFLSGRRAGADVPDCDGHLPEATYRRPVVLVCGDAAQGWPGPSRVLTASGGCWIRVEEGQDVAQVAREILWQRPSWVRQLAVMVSVCPQKHADTAVLTGRLLALRWQISRLRRESGHSVPLVLAGQAGSAVMREEVWQVALPGEGISVMRASSALVPGTGGDAEAMEQQVLMNSLMSWFQRHAETVFRETHPDIPALVPAVVMWGLGPSLPGRVGSGVWHAWLTRHTALREVAGWQPEESGHEMSLLPDFVLPLLPEGQGLTPRQRTWRCALTLFTVAAAVALVCSGLNNQQWLRAVRFDIERCERIPETETGLRAGAVAALREHGVWLNEYARHGAPLRMGAGLYQGERVRQRVLEAVRACEPARPVASVAEAVPEVRPAETDIRLDGLSLFDPGRAELKAGSARMLVSALMKVKARPGWLIMVAGHTDNTGSAAVNRALSLKRAEAVRDWLRETGEIPESCLAVQGYGADRPVAGNETAEGRARNRRVEISLVAQAGACRQSGELSGERQG